MGAYEKGFSHEQNEQTDGQVRVRESVVTTTWLLVSSLALAAPSGKELLDGADARIREHRTAEITLRILDGDGKPLAAGTSVVIEQTNHAFLFGCNIFVLGRFKTPEENAAYEKLFAELLNYATLPFYWWGYETQPEQPGHARIEEIARWCKAHHVTMKGHPLAWNYIDPKWIPQDIDLARSLQMARIFRETAHFKGTIGIWDVVNEATAYDRPDCWKNAPVTTRIIREQGVGPYVRQAFAAARAANPEATLVINDYRTDEDYASKVINELVDLEGKPLYDIVGIQSHQHGGAMAIERAWEICERFKRYGKPLHFTETTFVSGKQGWGLTDADKSFKWETTPEGEQRQADDVERFYTLLFSHPAVEAITWWDFSDAMAWQQAPAGLIRKDLTPKPAYERLKSLIKGKWWTKVRLETGPDGKVSFRGFLGEYDVRPAVIEQRPLTAEFRVEKNRTEPVEVRLGFLP